MQTDGASASDVSRCRFSLLPASFCIPFDPLKSALTLSLRRQDTGMALPRHVRSRTGASGLTNSSWFGVMRGVGSTEVAAHSPTAPPDTNTNLDSEQP